MQVIRTLIDGLLILEPRVFGDERGFFLESFNQAAFEAAIGDRVSFVQDNHSRSAYAVLRGMHFQNAPHAQGKLVRVTSGTVFDVAVDIRSGSPTFGSWVGIELSAVNHKMVWLPPGLAHGFLVTSEVADFMYKTTAYYAPEAEGCIRWDDPAIGIQWPTLRCAPVLARRDATAPLLGNVAESALAIPPRQILQAEASSTGGSLVQAPG
jgi:dTDP-4-dehydrorhamnose 3,5-epimerase